MRLLPAEHISANLQEQKVLPLLTIYTNVQANNPLDFLYQTTSVCREQSSQIDKSQDKDVR